MRLLITLFSSVLLLSCVKKEVPVTPEEYSIDVLNRKLVYTIDRTDSIEVDLDNDGKKDVSFTDLCFADVIRFGCGPCIYMNVYNKSLYFSGSFSNDTLFANHDTTYDSGPCQNYIVYNARYSFKKISDKDSILNIRPLVFKTLAWNRGTESVSDKSNYDWLDKVDLKYDPCGYQYFLSGTTSTLGLVQKVIYDNSNNKLPMNESFFLRFKIGTTTDIKNGWIKLLLESEANMLLIEKAIKN